MPELEVAYTKLGSLFAALPREWLHIGGDETLVPQLDEKAVGRTLARAFEAAEAFWDRP